MHLLALYAALALVAPYLLFRFYTGNDSIIYQGKAVVANIGLLGASAYNSASDFVTAILPDGSHIVFEQTKARLAGLSGLVQHPTLTVKRSLLGATYVSSVAWTEGGAAEVGETQNGGMYLSLVYLALAAVSLVFALDPATVAVVGRLGLVYSGVLFALSAFFLARFRIPAIGPDDEMRSLFSRSLGHGKVGVAISAVFAAGITVACFWIGGMVSLVGLSALLSLGMLLSMLTK